METRIEKDTLIIGAGLTGLTTAYYLSKKKADFLVIEKKDKVGGVINTVNENGFLYEAGPNTGVIGTPEAAELFQDLGGICEAEIPDKSVNKRYILKNAKWEPLPSGLWAGITTPLFSGKDKIRLLSEPFRKKGKNPDENLSSMVIRRLGKSFLDYAVEPFILGVYSGDPDYLIPRYALPKLYNLEQEYGSFIGGAIKKGFKKKSPSEKLVTRKVFSVKGGLSHLTDSLYTEACKDNFILDVQSLKTDFREGKYYSDIKTGKGIAFKIVSNKLVITTGAHSLNEILTFVQPDEINKVINLRYSDVVEVILGFKDWNGFNPDGFGGLIPSAEKRDLLGILFMSTLFKQRTPGNCQQFTVFMGGMRKPEIINKTENEIAGIIEREFSGLMNLNQFKPVLLKIFRHKNAIPQYGIDTGERIIQLKQLENKYPGLIIGGNTIDGIGMADRIKQGKHLSEIC